MGNKYDIDSFEWTQFKKKVEESLDTARTYAKEELIVLNQGGSRSILQLKGGMLLKLPRNNKGLEKNKIEIEIWKKLKNKSILPEIIEYDPSGNGTWIISKKTNDCSQGVFKEIFGISWDEFWQKLGSHEDITNKNIKPEDWGNIPEKKFERLSNYIIATKELLSNDVLLENIQDLKNWGIGDQGTPVLIKLETQKAKKVIGNSNDKEITVYNKEKVPKKVLLSKWRESLCLDYLEDASGDPKDLYYQLMQAHKTGVIEEAVPYAEKLYEIDTDKERGTTCLSIFLYEVGENSKALGLLSSYKKIGKMTPTIFTNLSKILKDGGRIDASREALWESLKLDPNQEPAICMYTENKSDKGVFYNKHLLERLSRLKGAWLPNIYLAKSHLKNGEIKLATEKLKSIIDDCEQVIPKEKIIRIAIEMEAAGLLKEMTTILLPVYEPSKHGLATGIMLIDALVFQKMFSQLDQLLSKLYESKNIKWVNTLLKIEEEIERKGGLESPSETFGNEHLDMLVYNRPLWMESEIEEKTKIEPILMIGGSIEIVTDMPREGDTGKSLKKKLSILGGYLLMISEYLQVSCGDNIYLLTPWVQGKGLTRLYVPRSLRHYIPLTAMGVTEVEESFASLNNSLTTENNKSRNDYFLDLLLHEEMVGGEIRWFLGLKLLVRKNWIKIYDRSIELDKDEPFSNIEDLLKNTSAYISKMTSIKTKEIPPWYNPSATSNYNSYIWALSHLEKIKQSNKKELLGSKTYNALNVLRGYLKIHEDSNRSIHSKYLLLSAIREIKQRRPQLIKLISEELDSKIGTNSEGQAGELNKQIRKLIYNWN
jgi:tetratricopeptide (TPR) repeat protein